MKVQRSILMSALAIVMVMGITLGSAKALEFGDWEDTWHKAKFKIKATCYDTIFLDFFKESAKDNAWIYIESYDAPNEFSAFLVTLDEDGITWQATPMTLRILHGTANEAMLELTDSIIITDGVSQDQVGLISFIAMMKGKEKNEAFKSGKINSICGEATTKLIGQGECVGPMTFSCEKKSEEKVPQEVIDAKDDASNSQPPPSTDIEIIASYLQYRTYFDPVLNRYQGFVEFQENGQPIDESDIVDITLKDQDQNEVTIDQIIFYEEDYYFGAWNSGQVNYSGPWVYTGYSIHFPDGENFATGNYTYEATTSQGAKLSDIRYFPGELLLPVVDSSTMTSEWTNGDLKLSWTIPFPAQQHDQVRVWLYNEQKDPELPLMIRLPNDATEVTIPAQVINNVKQLSNNVQTMDWLVLLYAIEGATNNSYARSFSDRKPIAGWSVQAQPQTLASGLNGPLDIQLHAASAYWVENYSDAVKKVPIDGGTTTVVASSTMGGNKGSLAIDATHIYWSDYSTIWMTELAGGPVTVLASGLTDISYLRVYSTDLYFRSNSGIEKADIGTGTVTTLIPAASPLDFGGGLAVDATGIYFPDRWKGTIFKSSLDGSQITTLAVGLNEPHSLLLDSGFLFWAEKESIRQMSSAGGTITTIVSDISPNQIAKGDIHIFWTDRYGGTIYKADLSGGAKALLAAAQESPSSLAVDTNSVYWICSGSQYFPPLGSVKKVPHSF